MKDSTNKRCYLIQTKEEIEDVEEIQLQQQSEKEPTIVENQTPHLSYHALKGISARGTIWFTRFIIGQEVQILLDGGSSDNFIQPRLAKILKLNVEPAPQFKVVIGNGQQLECEGQAKQILVNI